MAKAILVIDMPKSCAECKMSRLYGSWCNIIGDTHTNNGLDIADDCPLKPMPQKIDIELLNNMCKHCECLLNSCGKLCAYRSIDNDYCDEYEKLKGAIEQNEM